VRLAYRQRREETWTRADVTYLHFVAATLKDEEGFVTSVGKKAFVDSFEQAEKEKKNRVARWRSRCVSAEMPTQADNEVEVKCQG